MFVLRQWGAIVPVDKRGLYAAGVPLATGDQGPEAWFVRCALHAVIGALPMVLLYRWALRRWRPDVVPSHSDQRGAP